MRKLRYLEAAVFFLYGLLLVSCAGSGSFTSWSGFTEYFDKYPPSAALPQPGQLELLKLYQPRIYGSEGQPGPIDFYNQYIARGTLTVDGKQIKGVVTPELLNRHRESTEALFKYTGPSEVEGDHIVYARFDEDILTYQGNNYPLQFLTYNLVFPTSGMLHGLGILPSIALGIAGNLTDWHQLDHYVGLSMALYQQRPIAVMLQQHNYQTTYILGQNLTLPADGRVQVDIAMRSNELYLHSASAVRHPAVSFITADNIEFLMTGNNKPIMAGFDVTQGQQEIIYQLQTLPQTDAFYQFKGRLGKSRLLPGRDGPPGSDYTTLPALMPRAIRLVTGFRTESVDAEREKIAALFNEESFTVDKAALIPYIRDFVEFSEIAN